MDWPEPTGIYQPDAGEIFYEGRRLCFRSYRDSLAEGIDRPWMKRIDSAMSIAETIRLHVRF